MSGGESANAARMEVLDAFVTVSEDPIALMSIVAESSDRGDAARRVAERFGLGRIGAEAVVEMGLHRFTAVQRRHVAEERDEWARRMRGDT